MDIKQANISTLAKTALEKRLLDLVNREGDSNGQISEKELTDYLKHHPDVFEVVGDERIAEWKSQIDRQGIALPKHVTLNFQGTSFGHNALIQAERFGELLKSAGCTDIRTQSKETNLFGRDVLASLDYTTVPLSDEILGRAEYQVVRESLVFGGDAIRKAAETVKELKSMDRVPVHFNVSIDELGRARDIVIASLPRAEYEELTGER